MFELFAGWRYLYGAKPRRWVRLVFWSLVALAAAGLLAFFAGSGWMRFFGTLLFGGCALVASIFFLLRFFSVFTTISITSVLLGTTVLTIVWNVSSGFQREFKEKILGVNGHILLMPQGATFVDPERILETARRDPDVVEAAPFNLNEMLIVRKEKHSGILVKGIRPFLAMRVLDLPQHMTEGNMLALEQNPFVPDAQQASDSTDDSEETANAPGATQEVDADAYCRRPDHRWPGIILGFGLARRLGVRTGDAVTLVSPLSSFGMTVDTGTAVPSVRNLDMCVVGIFFAGFEEYDQKLSYVHLNVSYAFNPRVDDRTDTIFGIEMRLTDMERADAAAARLSAAYEAAGMNVRVVTWGALNPQVFQNLQFHRVVIWVLLFFLISVAAFGVLSSLYMLVLDKRREISILKAMGASDNAVARIFVFAGTIIGLLGMLIGQGLGLILCFLLRAYSFPLDPEVYIINRLPVSIQASNIGMISATTLALCILATLFPAFKAARARPVEGFLQKREL